MRQFSHYTTLSFSCLYAPLITLYLLSILSPCFRLSSASVSYAQKEMHPLTRFRITIYAPMIYTAPCVMFLMRADALRAGPNKSLVHRWFYEHENCFAGPGPFDFNGSMKQYRRVIGGGGCINLCVKLMGQWQCGKNIFLGNKHFLTALLPHPPIHPPIPVQCTIVHTCVRVEIQFYSVHSAVS
jgi:hypothetical protein